MHAVINAPVDMKSENETHYEKFFDTVHCRSRAHCTSCRHSEAFRQSIVNSGLASERDFPCIWNMQPPARVRAYPLNADGSRCLTCRPITPILDV